jgi:elongation factor G
VAYAFKLEDGRYGQLTFVRVYQGSLSKGDTVYRASTGKKIKIGRLVRIHANAMEDITSAGAGEIAGLFGIDCHSGETFLGDGPRLAMASMHVPDPVISLSVSPVDSKAQTNMSKALQRFTKEDPTFRVHLDAESGETIISGMGELHLDVYVERMKREYSAEVETGAPQVAYREAISRRGEFDYVHKKQTGGSGQYAKVVGYLEPIEEADYEFVDQIKGGNIPTEYIPACDKGFRAAMEKGRMIGFPVVGIRAVLIDGNSHSVDSSDMAFMVASRSAFRQAYERAKPRILEPVMKVEVEGPSEFQGAVYRTLMQRRGNVLGSTEDGGFARVEAEVPLAEMFGYSTDLRSETQGKAEFTMEFAKYAPAPSEVTEELKKKYSGQVAAEDD